MTDREKLRTELARVYHQEDAAHLLLDGIDFPRGRRQAFKTADLFWHQVFRELDNGVIRDGIDKLRSVAVDDYPGNRVFNSTVDGTTNDEEPLPGTGQELVDEVFAALAHNPIVLLLAQDGRAEPHVLRRIVARAGASHGADGAFYVTPPGDPEASAEAYFASLAQQCELDGDVRDATSWRDALDRRLRRGERLFLLVHRFDRGADERRCQLGTALRALSERPDSPLRMVLSGGEHLAALMYEHGDMSLLNAARRVDWPEPMAQDVLEWQRREYPQAGVDEREAEEILEFCGRHPRLVRRLPRTAGAAGTRGRSGRPGGA